MPPSPGTTENESAGSSSNSSTRPREWWTWKSFHSRETPTSSDARKNCRLWTLFYSPRAPPRMSTTRKTRTRRLQQQHHPPLQPHRPPHAGDHDQTLCASLALQGLGKRSWRWSTPTPISRSTEWCCGWEEKPGTSGRTITTCLCFWEWM